VKGSFVASRQAEIAPHAAGDDGLALQGALGRDEDAAVVELEDVLRMFNPFTCPNDALDAVGAKYGLPRYDGEPNGAAPTSLGGTDGSGYRGRLCNAWDAWGWAGTANAVTDQLLAYGFGDVLILPVWQFPAPFHPETSGANYSSFYVFITDMGSTGIQPLTLGSWTLGDSGSVLGSTMTAAQLGAVKRIVLKWKSPHGLPIKIFLVFPGQAAFFAPALAQYQIARTLGSILTVLGDAGFVLGGYNL
jgi:hypothetical protein